MNEGFVVSSLVSSAMSFFFFLYLHAQKLRPTHSLVLFLRLDYTNGEQCLESSVESKFQFDHSPIGSIKMRVRISWRGKGGVGVDGFNLIRWFSELSPSTNIKIENVQLGPFFRDFFRNCGK